MGKKALSKKKSDVERQHEHAAIAKKTFLSAVRKANASTVEDFGVVSKTARKCHKFRLFMTSSDSETENSPKIVRQVIKSRKKGVKRSGTSISVSRTTTPSVKEGTKKLKYARLSTPKPMADYPSIETFQDKRTSTPKPVVDYPSIETFREKPAEHGLDWSFVPRTSLQSMCDSFQETTSADSSDRLHHSFTFPQPWLPTGVRQRSFFNIKKSACVSVESPQTETLVVDVDGDEEDKNEGGDDNSSSYTSVYTWATATGTVTATTGQTVSLFPGVETQTTEKEGRRDSRTCSPSLILKNPLLHNLHSTAIHPTQDVHHLQQTPQVSPIKFHPDDDRRQHTPHAPTQHLSPRGPRKSQSFITMPARGAQPKCSTMLFSTPVADTGGIPLDVSSIRMALPEILDLDGTPSTIQNKQPGSAEDPESVSRGKVLTSTPYTGGHGKLMWNLSCVHAPSDEDELVPLERSRDTVNSQEIMAVTLTEGSVRMVDSQDKQPHSPKHRSNQHPESGVMLDSPSDTPPPLADSIRHCHPVELSSVQKAQKSPAVEDSGHGRHPNMRQIEVWQDEAHEVGFQSDDNVAEVKEAEDDNVMSDEADKGEEERKLGRDSKSKNTRVVPSPRKRTGSGQALRCPYRVDDGEDTQTSDSSYTYHLSINDHLNISPRKSVGSRQRRSQARQNLLAQFDSEVEACPVSAISRVSERGKHSTAHLFLWVEPSDSGFYDMISQAPPDIVGMVSKQSLKRQTSASH